MCSMIGFLFGEGHSGCKIKVSERSENTGGVWEDFRLIWEVFAAVPGKGKGGLGGVVVVCVGGMLSTLFLLQTPQK